MNILELIQEALKKAGIDIKHAERIQKLFKIEKEEGIDDFVTLFKDNILPVIPVEDPTAAATAKAAAIAEYEATHKLKDGKAIETIITPALPTNMDAATKAIIDAQAENIRQLTELVSGVVKTTGNAQKLEQVKAKLKGKVDEKFLERIALKVNLDAENLDTEIEAHIADFTEMKQGFINDAVAAGTYVPPVGSSATSDKEFDSFLDSKTKDEESEFKGKEI